MRKLKILVFDDTEDHRQSAVLLLSKDHDLTVVGTYDEAQTLLLPKYDSEFALDLFAEKYGDKDPYRSEGVTENERKERIDFYYGPARKEATKYPEFDVVLTDLLVPASSQSQGSEGLQYVGQEMPLGTIIALLALAAGTKMVAVVTDKNHHHHPASAALDRFYEHALGEYVRIICTNRVQRTPIDEVTGEAIESDFLTSAEGKIKYPYPEGKTWGDQKGLRWGGKNWKLILQNLVGEVEILEP